MNSGRARRLLMVVHDFPPGIGGGILRPLKFVTHLPHFGWTPVVLTIRESDCRGHDAGLLAQLPAETELHRTRSLIPPGRAADVRDRFGDRSAGEGPLRPRPLNWLRDHLLVPDSRLAWWPFALPRALRISRSAGFDAIYATAPPFSSLLLGRHLKRLTHRPLLCDFRDPWSHEFTEGRSRERSSRQSAETRMERSVIRDADAVVATSPGLLEAFHESYDRQPSSKFHLVTNGFDPDDYAGIVPVEFERFAIVYTGKVRDIYSPEPFFEGLRRLAQRRPALIERCEVHFLGEFDPDLRNFAQDPLLSRIVTLHGHVDHRVAMAHQLGADLLLAVLRDVETWRRWRISAKLFEYLYAGPPILGILPPTGPTARLITETEAGVVVSPGDFDGVARVIERHLDRWEKGSGVARLRQDRAAREEAIAPYSRRAQTGKLADILERIVGGAL